MRPTPTRSLMFSALLGLTFLPHVAAAQTASLPAPVASDSRVKTLVYNENDVYNLLTYYGFQSNIEFGPKETIETVSIGDRAGWQLVPAGRRLFVRAVANELHTNMTVVTNMHAYQFDLRATDPATVPQEELVYVIRFFYPDDAEKMRRASSPVVPAAPTPSAYPMPAAAPMNAYPTPTPQPSAMPVGGISSAPLAAPVPQAPAPQAMQPAALPASAQNTQNRYGAGPFDTPVSPATLSAPATQTPAATPAAANKPGLNYNYTYTGAGKILPYAMYDDGKRTYFQFLDAKSVPKVRALDANGKAKSLKLKKEGDYMVASVVASRFELALGDQKASIFNEARP